MLDHIATLLHRATRGLVLVLMSLILGIVVVQITLRYGFSRSLTWSEEFVRYLLIWLTFTGASVAVKEGSLVGLDLLERAAHRAGFDLPLRVLILTLSLLFTMVLGYYGTLLAMSPSVMRQSFATMPVSMVWVYSCVPVSAVLMGIQLINMIVNTLMSKEAN